VGICETMLIDQGSSDPVLEGPLLCRD